jgi:predicted GNAT family N-acyltransferase
MDDELELDSARAPLAVRWTVAPAELAGALALRHEVFVVEQGVPPEEELDGRDAAALHLVAIDAGSGEVVGTLRMLLDGASAKIGRVAVARRFRRRGLARRMLALALQEARARGARSARLAAQTGALALYEDVGFVVESEVFEEAGIEHVWMSRGL